MDNQTFSLSTKDCKSGEHWLRVSSEADLDQPIRCSACGQLVELKERDKQSIRRKFEAVREGRIDLD